MESAIDETIRSEEVEGSATSPAGNNLFNISPDSALWYDAMKQKFHSVIAK